MLIDLDLPAPIARRENVSAHRPHWMKLVGRIALAACCLLSLSAANPSVPSKIAQLASITGYLGYTDQVIVHKGMIIVPGFGEVAAFSPDGIRRWTIPADFTGSDLAPMPIGDLLVLSGFRPGPQGGEAFTFAVDIVTGKRMWESAGSPEYAGDYIVVHADDGSLKAVDAKTLLTVFRLGPQRASIVDAATNTIVTVSLDGWVHLYELPEGHQEFAPIQVNIPERAQVFLHLSRSQIILDLIDQSNVDALTWPGPASQTVIDRATREVREGQITQEAVDMDCGPVICHETFGPDRPSITLISRDNDWRRVLGPGQWATWTPDGLLITTMDGLLGLVEPRTGDVLVSLTGWGSVLSNPTQHLLLFRITSTRMDLAQIGERGVQPIGEVHVKSKQCTYESPVLVCSTQDGQIGVWELARTR